MAVENGPNCKGAAILVLRIAKFNCKGLSDWNIVAKISNRPGRAHVRFGILYEIHTPKPWHENSDYDRYWECIDEIKNAEAVGFDNCWAVEHHFTEEFAHCSAPEVF